MAFADARGIEILAISDDEPEELEPFLRRRREPFPGVVASDPLRRTFRRYAVRVLPTFALVDEQSVLQWYQRGYRPQTGLEVEGWQWTGESP